MLVQHYLQIRFIHVTCVALSGALFTVRGVMRLADVPLANHRSLRLASYVIDTTLLTAAVGLMLIIHQYPLANSWLTAKVLLLVLYIGLGTMALKYGRSGRERGLTFGAALLTYTVIIGIAIAHHPAGWLYLLRH
jgi:uncharacterized membrane protein SirB2